MSQDDEPRGRGLLRPLRQRTDKRIVCHVDLDYFFAQCEELRDPQLKGKPVVVCVYSGRSDDSGAVSTANYEARELGVESGMPISEAKEALSDVDSAFLPVDKDYYSEVSGQVMEILRDRADTLEVLGLDEAFLGITRVADGNYEVASSVARSIKEEVEENLGLTSSLGVGPNKLVAKVASEEDKPAGITVVSPEAVRDFLDPLPVTRIYGIGKTTKEVLEGLDATNVTEITEVDPSQLISSLGESMGRYVYRAAHGLHDSPVTPTSQKRQISRITTLEENTRKKGEIYPVLEDLSEEVWQRTDGALFRTVSVVGIFEDLSTHTKSHRFRVPRENREVIAKTGKKLLDSLLARIGESDLRRVGVRVSDLIFGEAQRKLRDYRSDRFRDEGSLGGG